MLAAASGAGPLLGLDWRLAAAADTAAAMILVQTVYGQLKYQRKEKGRRRALLQAVVMARCTAPAAAAVTAASTARTLRSLLAAWASSQVPAVQGLRQVQVQVQVVALARRMRLMQPCRGASAT